MNEFIKIELKAGLRTALMDGTLVFNSPKHMATEHLYKASAGNRISIHSEEYLFAIALFSTERDLRYLYTYDYQCESNWSTYQKNLTPDSYTDQEYIFEEECYFRICVKRRDGQDITSSDADRCSRALRYEIIREDRKPKEFFEEEIRETVQDILSLSKGLLAFCVLTDTHYTINGTWEDTAMNIRAIHEQVHFDEIIHLGDITDGITSAKVTSDYVKWVKSDLQANQVPVRMVLGNHDSNYFRSNPEKFTIEEQIKLYLEDGNERSAPYYYVDYPEFKLRCLFLHSFDNEAPIRYGFSDAEIEWVRATLKGMKNGGNVIVFSHDAPFAELDYWSYSIHNGEQLMKLLEEYNAKSDYHILGYFYGHTHSDLVYEECSFPLVSIGCAKCEYFEDKKPEGAYVPKRQLNTITQDLWDTMLLDIDNDTIYMIRFGAGENRRIDCSKKNSIREKLKAQRKRNRRTKVWAHRGASAYAPENTLPAFLLALELGSDGVELDVHLTKDGIPVVIHDETIDRVSDGRGYVRDYTIQELKKFNFGKNFPAFKRVEIPTLEEVFILLQCTEVIINVELKNHYHFYPELEEKVMALAKEYGMEDKIWYSSFNHPSMAYIKQLKQDAKVAFLHRDSIIDIAEYVGKHNVDSVHPEFVNIKYPGYLQECKKNGIEVHVWTINEERELALIAELGVEAVITNYPDRAVRVIEKFSIE